MVSNREQAEDLIQEIFVKAYFALDSFEGQSSFYTWLYRIASNHCLDFLRKHKPIQISIDRPLSEDSELTFENTLQAPRSDDPEAPIEAPSEAAALLAAIRTRRKADFVSQRAGRSFLRRIVRDAQVPHQHG